MIYSWKSNELSKSGNERRMQELDKKLKVVVNRVIESSPVHKSIETMAKNYVKLGHKMINGKIVKVVKKVA